MNLIGILATIIHVILIITLYLAIAIVHDKNNLFKLFVIVAVIGLSFVGFKRCIVDIVEEKYNGKGQTVLQYSHHFLKTVTDIENSYTLHAIALLLSIMIIKILYFSIQDNICPKN